MSDDTSIPDRRIGTAVVVFIAVTFGFSWLVA
jgi:hypothetical protein